MNHGALFAGALAGFWDSATGGAGWEPPAVEDIRRELPQYTIERLIGRGGMGAIYQGVRVSLGRTVAIKVLPPGIDREDLQFAARFKQEAKALAMLHHPGIVGVHDAGETPGGLLYLVMEFVAGQDVAGLLAAQGKLPPAEAVRIAARVCEALSYAHERGVVHRDIKPSNVMIETEGAVKVADFGLAKITVQDHAGFTRSDIALGSPEFAAPESSIPGIRLDGRADLYSLGVMLYQMLTGGLPRGRFDPPSGLIPRLDKRLDAIVDRALQTDREKRYSSALEMGKDMERVISGRRSLAPRLAAAAGRRTLTTPLLVGVALALLLVSAVTIVRRRGETKPVDGKSAAAAVATGQNVLPQWQKIEFAGLDPAVITAGRPNLAMEAGRLRVSDFDRWVVPMRLGSPSRLLQRNVAIRATFRVRSGSNPKLTLRLQHFAESQYYLVVYSESLCLCRQVRMDQPELRMFELSHIPAEGEEVAFQLASVGHRLYVWFDGTLLGHVDDDSFDQPGEFGIQAKDGSFKSVEYILLDGLPESEALKLIEIQTP